MRLTICAMVAAVVLAAPMSAHAADPKTCSESTASRVGTRLNWGGAKDQPGGRTPIAEVLCGPFLGAGSRGMVASVAVGAGCGGSVEWAVFRYRGGRWRIVMEQRHGAFLSVAGTAGIRETIGAPRPGDPKCAPSRWKTRVWHWTGKRFTKTAWTIKATKPNPSSFLSADRQVWCQMADDETWCANTAGAQMRLKRNGELEVCDGLAYPCIQNWDDRAPLLAHGETSEVGGFRCTSAPDGITCTVIATGKGFRVSAEGTVAVAP